ncbi:MAG: hypothetical protein R3Y27_09345 [Clostridia bacterium]
MLFFEKNIIDEKQKTYGFNALENGEKIGSCSMKIEQDAEIFSLSFQKDKPYAVEGLIKSALNSATFDSVYMAKCKQEDIAVFLRAMKFEKVGDFYQSDIPTVLMGNCGCHG